jgi:hypothetical protein
MNQPETGPIKALGHERETSLPPTLRELLLTIAKHAIIAGIVISLLVHATGWIVARYVTVGGYAPSATGSGDDGAIEMAVVTEAELQGIEDAAIGMDTPSVPEAAVSDVPLAEVMDAAPGDGGEGSLGELSDVGPAGGGGDISGDGGGGLGGSGGGGGASFFGVEAQGNRFAYVVDVSGSMDELMGEQRRIGVLRTELSRSINSLLESSSFVIVKFSTESKILGESEGWTEAGDAGKRAARRPIDGLLPEGSTIPLPAFEIVLGLRPRPDAVYFMTDGEFPEEMADEILLMSKKFRIPVHCICLGSAAGETVMKKIAKGTRGTYTFVPAP